MINPWWLTGAYVGVALLSLIAGWIKNISFIILTGFVCSLTLLSAGFYNAIYEESLFTKATGLFCYGAGGYLFFLYFSWLLEEREYRQIYEQARTDFRRAVEKSLWRSRN